MTLYRIHWRTLNGATGHGDQQLTWDEANRIADELNSNDLDWIVYWAEPVPAATATETPDDKESTDN